MNSCSSQVEDTSLVYVDISVSFWFKSFRFHRTKTEDFLCHILILDSALSVKPSAD